MIRTDWLVLSVFSMLVPGLPDEARDPIRVACVGDSITRGHSVTNPETDGYPAVLGRLLGPDYDVRNFGHDGTTMLRASGRPYWSVAEFQAATDFRPDVVVIMLGTNDAHPPLWRERSEQFQWPRRSGLKENRTGVPEARQSRERFSTVLPALCFRALSKFSTSSLPASFRETRWCRTMAAWPLRSL